MQYEVAVFSTNAGEVLNTTRGLSTALLGCHGIVMHQNSSHCGLSTVSNGEAKIADSIPHVRENVPLPFPFQCHHHLGIHVVACRRLLLECFSFRFDETVPTAAK